MVKTRMNLYQKWSLQYLLQLGISALMIFITYYAGYFICEARVWHPDDAWYAELKWMKDHAFSVGIFLLLVLAVVFAIRLFKQFAQNIDQISAAVGQLYSDKNESITLSSQLVELEKQMNQVRIQNYMNVQSAKEANQRKNDMIMYMAHDLKTPLTSVIGYLDLVCREPEMPRDSREKYTNIAYNKALRLEDLVNEFFDITRFNFSHMILEKSRVDLSMMIKQMVAEFEQEFKKKGLRPVIHIENKIEVMCDVDKMERVFDNLFKNIVNYSYKDTEIDIEFFRQNDKQVKLVTTNHGKTIPKEMLEHIFEQFFRMDSSRNSNTGGSGLGLAVAKEIVNLHGGTICCDSENEIICFTILLPANL